MFTLKQAASGSGNPSAVVSGLTPSAGDLIVATVYMNLVSNLSTLTIPSGFSIDAKIENNYHTCTAIVSNKAALASGSETSLTFGDSGGTEPLAVIVQIFSNSGGSVTSGASINNLVGSSTTLDIPASGSPGLSTSDNDLAIVGAAIRGGSAFSSWSNSFIDSGLEPQAPATTGKTVTAYKLSSGGTESTTLTLAASDQDIGGLMVVFTAAAAPPPANGIPSLTVESKSGTPLAAGTSVSVTVDTTAGTNVYAKTALTITSANKIPVIDLSSAVTAGTIANGDTVNYRVDYGGETTIVPQTVVASPT